MNWWLTLGSLAGVLALAGIAHLLRLGGAESLDEDEVFRLMADEGVTVDDLALSLDERAALVRTTRGDLLLVKRHGTGTALRRLASPPRSETRTNGTEIHSGDRRFGSARFDPAEVERLTS